MKPANITLINGIVLIAISLWSYFGADQASFTALIPLFFGLIFLILFPSYRKGNKAVAHIVVVLTLLLVLSFSMPLRGALQREDTMAILRVGLMLISSLVAMIIYVRSFMLARRK
jgi:hypothetical protein